MAEDVKQVRGEINSFLVRLGREYPQFMRHFGAFGAAVEGSGALDTKTKELISVALAVKSQCVDCIVYHTGEAVKAGATRDEVVEAAFVAVLMHGGPALMHVRRVLEVLDELSR